jgi:hypothetical protein
MLLKIVSRKYGRAWSVNLMPTIFLLYMLLQFFWVKNPGSFWKK